MAYLVPNTSKLAHPLTYDSRAILSLNINMEHYKKIVKNFTKNEFIDSRFKLKAFKYKQSFRDFFRKSI